MNPFLKKEIRLLLPNFLAGVALTFPLLFLPDLRSSTGFRVVLFVFPFLLCPAMAVMMALSSFGAEVSAGTFSNLLAQPVPRTKVWQTKILLQAAALSIIGILWCTLFYLHNAQFKHPQNQTDFADMFVGAWMFLLVVFSGGLWTVLLLRQVAAAFWFTLLTPGAILVLTISLAANLSDVAFEEVLLTVLGIYVLAGFGFARWLFLRAQDTQWTGGTIAMPEMRGVSLRPARSGTARRWRPRAALWWKEIQLHQSQFIMAGVLTLLHLGVLATRHWGHFEQNSTMAFVLDSFWCLWLVMPLLVGCAAMAEERKMGTLDGQLCLPIRRRSQFITKFLTVLMVSVVLGIVMPLLLEGTRILPDFHIQKMGNSGFYLANSYNRGLNGTIWGYMTESVVGLTAIYTLASLSPYLPFLFMAAICIIVAAISFYASTLSRNTLQALAPAVLGLLLTWFLLMVAAMPYEFGLGFLWRGNLIFLLLVPVMMVVLAVLTYGNCQRGRVGGGVWGRNLLTLGLALALVTVSTSAIYHRAWELLSPLEAPHGAARWTTTNPPRMQTDNNRITIYLPDGRVWMNRYDWDASNPFETKIIESRMFGSGKFLAGTNWQDVQDCWRDIIGIQRDGSLWVSEKPDNFIIHSIWLGGKIKSSEATKLARFGSDHDWKSIGGRFIFPFLLKTDGTMWLWGTNRWDSRKPWPGLHAFTPRRLGTDADWEKIFSDNGRTYFCKTNGQVWTDRAFSENDEKLDLGNGLALNRVIFLENKKLRNAASIGQVNWAPFQGGILEDGTFREVAVWERIAMTPETSKTAHTNLQHKYVWKYTPRDGQIGQTTNWQAMAVNGDAIMTLKADGTLWKWDFSQSDYRGRPVETPDLKSISPAHVSTHSDWVAIGAMMGGIVSLAADGSLWLWCFEPERNYYGGGEHPPLLGASRRPIFLGNIFGKAE
jgi:ABC-type transport system involved in multi-copper enzyme maturation permease subunit